MSVVRTLTRSAAVLGAGAALALAGASAASAATTQNHTVDGNTVSVKFTWASTPGELDLVDTCGAALIEPAAALDLASTFAGGDILGIFESLLDKPGVHILTEEGIVIDRPVVTLSSVMKEATVKAEVATGIYTLVSVCTDTANEPNINPFVLVGDPLEAVMGSVDGLSSGDGAGLDTLSAVLGGEDESGLGAVLSSALGAEGEADLLGTLSDATGDK